MCIDVRAMKGERALCRLGSKILLTQSSAKNYAFTQRFLLSGHRRFPSQEGGKKLDLSFFGATNPRGVISLH